LTWRVIGGFGLAWAILFAIGAIVLQGEPPAYDQPLADARAFFIDGAKQYLIGDYIAGIAFFLCFLPFIVGLQRLLGQAEGEPQIASLLVLVGGLATVVVGGTATVFLDGVALALSHNGLEDTTIRMQLHANAVAIAPIGFPMALMSFGAAWVIWRTHVLWPWLAAIAGLAGILHVIGAAFPLTAGEDSLLFFVRFVALIAFVVFVLSASVNMLMMTPNARTPPNG
jgi:hypothetical protein